MFMGSETCSEKDHSFIEAGFTYFISNERQSNQSKFRFYWFKVQPQIPPLQKVGHDIS